MSKKVGGTIGRNRRGRAAHEQSRHSGGKSRLSARQAAGEQRCLSDPRGGSRVGSLTQTWECPFCIAGDCCNEGFPLQHVSRSTRFTRYSPAPNPTIAVLYIVSHRFGDFSESVQYVVKLLSINIITYVLSLKFRRSFAGMTGNPI